MKEVVANYRKTLLKRMIILCWVFLFICFVVKIFGGNFFTYIGNSKFAEYIDERLYLLIPFQATFYIIGTYLFYQTVTMHTHKLHSIIIVLIMCILKQLIKLGEVFVIIAFIAEFIFMFIYPILIFKCNIVRVIYVNLLLIIFQIISLITKNMGLIVFNRESVVMFIYMIDYYIMVGLLFLYTNKKEDKSMEWGLWFLSKNKEQLEAYKKYCINKHEKKIAKIDEKIAKAK